MTSTENDDKQRSESDLTGLLWTEADAEPRGTHELAPGLSVLLPISAYAEHGGLVWNVEIDVVEGRLACTRLDVARTRTGRP